MVSPSNSVVCRYVESGDSMETITEAGTLRELSRSDEKIEAVCGDTGKLSDEMNSDKDIDML